ncbi:MULTISPECIES: helix-turn-helix domain-containing protein [unclassified Spirulina]|uniref:helix-turn-helix domain-containing protein n=1 Tax=unclassified Spirulina TaxID=2684457 RepID=UPI00194F7F4F|nr:MULTISPECIES: helix-turn-helix transcriptional regulator [Spirulina]MEA5469432.1 helix-turn-helix transcriptional regulator [Spirulina sp. 06S082]
MKCESKSSPVEEKLDLSIHRKALLKIKNKYKISNVSISRLTGISENHLSQFFRGNRNATDAVLDEILNALENISPGSREEYGLEIAQSQSPQSLQKWIEGMSNEEMYSLLVAISQRYRPEMVPKNRNII